MVILKVGTLVVNSVHELRSPVSVSGLAEMEKFLVNFFVFLIYIFLILAYFRWQAGRLVGSHVASLQNWIPSNQRHLIELEKRHFGRRRQLYDAGVGRASFFSWQGAAPSCVAGRLGLSAWRRNARRVSRWRWRRCFLPRSRPGNCRRGRLIAFVTSPASIAEAIFFTPSPPPSHPPPFGLSPFCSLVFT